MRTGDRAVSPFRRFAVSSILLIESLFRFRKVRLINLKTYKLFHTTASRGDGRISDAQKWIEQLRAGKVVGRIMFKN